MRKPRLWQMNQQAQAIAGSTVQQAGRDIINYSLPQDESSQPGLVSVAPPWGLLDTRVRGRDHFVDEIAASVSDPSGKIYVLHGGGGYGKSTVALAVARIAASRTIPVWWVSGVEQPVLFEGMRAIALRLGASPDAVDRAWSGRGSAPDLFWQIIDSYQRPWLLVMDNVDEPQYLAALGARTVDGTGWLRKPESDGTVIVTTRDGDHRWWGSGANLIRIPTLSVNDACHVLLDAAGTSAGTQSQAQQLAVQLGGLPLALRIAGAYLATACASPPLPGLNRPTNFRDYSLALEARFPELIEVSSTESPGTVDSRQLIKSTWELSLDLLETRGYKWARPILRLTSCFAPAVIPYALLDASSLSQSQLFSDITPEKLLGVLQALADLDLIEGLHANPSQQLQGISIHPVVRDANRHQPDLRLTLTEYARVVTRLLAKSCAELDPDAPSCAESWRSLVAHCSSALQLWSTIGDIGSSDLDIAAEASVIACSSACFLYRYGRLFQAELQLRAVLEFQRRYLGESKQETLYTRYNLARVWRAQGEWSQAEQEFNAVIEVQRRVIGEEHPDTLAARNQLGFVLRAQGQWSVAELEFRSVLSVQERTLGERHQQTLLTRHNLGYVLYEQGKLPEAEQELQTVLRLREGVLGKDHAHTLFTRYNLVRIAVARSRWALAEDACRRLLSDQEHALGPEHPDTLKTWALLGNTLACQGKRAAAIQELKAVLERQQHILGEQHPETQFTDNRLRSLMLDEDAIPGKSESEEEHLK